MEYLQNLSDGSAVPILTAFLLGLLTALSPCPLATNIAAVGYISKDLENRRRVFFNGLALHARACRRLHLAGGGADCRAARRGKCFRHSEGNRQMGRNADRPGACSDRIVHALRTSARPAEIRVFGSRRAGGTARRMGCVSARGSFSLAFCPTSGVFYFGMLIPMSAAETAAISCPPYSLSPRGSPWRSSHGSWHMASPDWGPSATGCRPFKNGSRGLWACFL